MLLNLLAFFFFFLKTIYQQVIIPNLIQTKIVDTIIYLLFRTDLDKGTYAYGSGLPFFLTSPPAFGALYSIPGDCSNLPLFNGR